MFPSVISGQKNPLCWIPINSPVILAISTLAGFLTLQIMGGGGSLAGLAFGGFFSLMSIGTLFGVAALVGAARGCLGYTEHNLSQMTLNLICAAAIISALIISFFICNAISSLPPITPLQGLGLAGLSIGMFGAVNLIAYGCKRGYEAYNKRTIG